jgi:hypothetical protein
MLQVVDARNRFARAEDRRRVESLFRSAQEEYHEWSDARLVGSRPGGRESTNAGPVLARGVTTGAGPPPTQTLSNSLAWAMPGAGRPHSLAVTRARATSCRHRNAERVAANSSRTVL